MKNVEKMTSYLEWHKTSHMNVQMYQLLYNAFNFQIFEATSTSWRFLATMYKLESSGFKTRIARLIIKVYCIEIHTTFA